MKLTQSLDKSRFVTSVWVVGSLLFIGWIGVLIGGILLGWLVKSATYANALAWLTVVGFFLSGSIIIAGFFFKRIWNLSDEAIAAKYPKFFST